MRAGGLLLSLFIALSSFASTEHAVGIPELGPAPYLRFATSIGSDGTDFFAAWNDHRAPWGNIIGTRVTAAGEILDRTGIPIALGTALAPAQAPLVVWGGSSYLIFFTTYDSRISTSNLFVVRVDREGRILGPRQLLATDAATAGSRFAASNGSRTVVGYRHTKSNDVRALVLDQDAMMIADVRLAGDSVQRGHLSVAARGSEFAIAWHALHAAGALLEGTRITASGELRDATPLSLGNGLNPHIASDGSAYALVALRPVESTLIWTSRAVSADLEEVSEARDLPDGRLLQYPSLLFRGDRYEVVAQRADDLTNLLSLVSVRIERDGTPAGLRSLGPLPYGGFDPQPNAAANGSGRLFVAWNDWTRELYSTQILGRVYLGNALPAATPELLLSESADPHYAPGLATNGSGFLATWSEVQGLWATRLTHDGQSIDGRGILLDPSRAEDTAVVFDGTRYVVVSSHGLDLSVRYISPQTGTVQSTLTLGGFGVGGVAAAVSKDAVFVAWADHEGIQLTRIPHTTRMAEMPIRVSPENEYTVNGTYALAPAIAFNGSELLVTWTLGQEVIGSPSYQISLAIHGARVTASTLSLIDAAPLVIGDIEGRHDDESSVASNGKDWLVVWNGEQSMFARRVRRDSGVQGDAPAAIAAASRGTNNVAWDGARYVVAWKELDWEKFPLRLGHISASGTIAPAVTTLHDETLTPQEVIPLVAGPFGLGIAYVRRSTAPEHGSVERTFLRLVTRQDKRRAVR
jgi:hypothetical protein